MTDRPSPQKSADAYRTIGEVADELNLPQHVLRFWETRFPQVKPLKRAGGRRFYRPEDVALLRAVQALLYGEGYTIRGVQRLLAEHGARHVADALARARTAPSAVGGDARDEEDDAAMPNQDRPIRREPALAPPRPAPPDPSRPAAGLTGPPQAPAGDGTDLAGRLADVLSDLDDCRRLLSSVRSTSNC